MYIYILKKSRKINDSDEKRKQYLINVIFHYCNKLVIIKAVETNLKLELICAY